MSNRTENGGWLEVLAGDYRILRIKKNLHTHVIGNVFKHGMEKVLIFLYIFRA